MYGGSHSTIEPAFELATARGGNSLFASGSYRRSYIGLPGPDNRDSPLHDHTREVEGFAFLDHVINDGSRVSLISGTSNERNEIPGVPVAGVTNAASRHGEERNANHYAIATYQRSAGDLTLQASLSTQLSRASVVPVEGTSLVIDGEARSRDDRRASAGIQIEAAYEIGTAHVVRAGVIGSLDRQRRRDRVNTIATLEARRTTERRHIASAFVEDEWKLTPRLTANFGVRLDHVAGLSSPTHLGPRASLSWAGAGGVTVHGGYARYFIAPPLGEARIGERDDYFDVGAERQSGDFTVGIDAFARFSRDLLDERLWRYGPIGDSFAYRRARSHGIELSTIYADGPVTAWANVAISRSEGRGISLGRSLLSTAQLAAVDGRWVRTDLDQLVTASAGASHRFGPLLLSADMLYGSGSPRTATGGIVNAARLPAHLTVDMAGVYHLKPIEDRATDLRLDVTNAFDHRFALNDGTALAAGAPQWAAGRAVFVGIEQSF